tara:strand:+ start:2201 stop:2809 length:609 start_codon:yes stop_codon:yes gene_type:complete
MTNLDFQRVALFLKKWGLSILLVFFSWFIIKQFWWALRFNIFFAVSYDHVIGFNAIYFLMDNLTLIIHEAGHTILGIFGWRFLTILGGTLFQLILPLLIVNYGWRNRKFFITQLALFWLGFSWFDTAAYCADAFHRQLPLIGNLPKTAHDFFNILNSLNLLEHYKSIAWALYALGMIICVFAVLWPLFIPKETEHISLDLEL